MVGISPQDESEGMLAAQMVALHNAAMECFRRAMIKDQTFAGGSKTSASPINSPAAMRWPWKPSTSTGAKDSRKSQSSTSTSIKAARPSSAMSRPGRGYNKNQEQPDAKQLPMHLSPRCGAHSRRSGKPCRNGAMKNGRCRMHGGKSTGAPKGNRNAMKHGNYTPKERARRMAMKYLLRIV